MSKKEKLTYLTEDAEDAEESTKSESPVQKLKNKLKQCQKEKEEYLSQAQRTMADFINFRRRQEETVEELRKYGQANLIRELLPVLDSLEIGGEKNQEINQIKEQLKNILEKIGLKEIKAIGEKFNPEFHEAVEQTESDKESGIVVEEAQKGYLLGEKILRVSKVKIVK